MLRKNKVVRSEILLDRLVRCYTKSSSSGGSSTSISSSATTISSTANNSSIVNNRIFGPQNKSFSVATESHQLYNYTKLLQTIQSVTEKKQQFARIPLSSADSLFFQRRKLAEKEPYNHSENILYDKQIMIEEEQRTIAVEQYALMMKDLMKSGNATGTKSVRKMILNWYEPLTELILEERKLVARGDKTNDRGNYGPLLLMLPVEKLSLITLDTAINAILKTGNYGTKLTKVAMDIADTIETEVSITNAKNRRKTLSKTHSNLINKITSSARTTRFLKARIKELNNGQTWSHALKVKLGSALFSLLLRCCHTEDGSMAFIHTTDYDREKQKSISRIGLLQLEHNCYQQIANSDFPVAIPRFLPMLVPPKSWNSKEFDGAYYKLQAPLMKTTMKSQTNAVKNSNIPKVTEGLDYLGSIPWKINRDMLDVVISLWNSGEALGDLPPGQDLVVPEYEEFAESYKEKILSKDISDEIITNKSVKGEDDNKPFSKLELAYRDLTRRIKKKNAELHSLRCDTKIKLSIANRFVGEKIYYPYNLDFRGRAYPVPPNLTHLGSDLSRGLLTFAEEKILGKKGFMWLKVHLANLFGNNKITLEDRAKWTEDNIENVIDSAENPLTGKKWWQSAEEPFQALATCIEIAKASKLDNPELYQCSLPVHQDGSCNGLQHYAGLGRDHPGAVAVNLVPSNSPQDVYSRVLDIVKEQIEGDASIPFNHPVEMERIKGECARLVKDLVSRKVIKQTVMTSVYGVTRTGARAQIQARLEELVQTDSSVSNVAMDRKLFQAANYLASLTLISLEKMFTSAKEIMDWLATCAVLVSDKNQSVAWLTPLGLPAIQPYRGVAKYTVKTVLQTISLAVDDEFLPVSVRKQKSAFPPNFVHSLDATHMLMTALRMKSRQLAFASVHDSYWTHASDVEEMNTELRKCFVELYSYPILEELHASLVIRFPDIKFPPIPKRGTLDIREVNNSRYFFH